MNITVIVPTYKRPQALRLSFLNFVNQGLLPNEVMIADNGSSRETRETVLEMKMALLDLAAARSKPFLLSWSWERGQMVWC